MLSRLARKAASSQTRLKGYVFGSDSPFFVHSMSISYAQIIVLTA
jgi:hypothetical protein